MILSRREQILKANIFLWFNYNQVVLKTAQVPHSLKTPETLLCMKLQRNSLCDRLASSPASLAMDCSVTTSTTY